ncbi:hypothetical protein ACFO5Q_09570 [Kordiimonas lipolytica]|uniref:Uncharacterized protein n=1 Tax=Kordiimonas lipolytica TaxID=1662421 RepID=A0ABV8UB86_9PROT|nr:hypothetical protein [Kordiimonas lipolytica]
MNETSNLERPADASPKPAKKNRIWLFLAWAVVIGMPPSWTCFALFDAGYSNSGWLALAALPFAFLLLIAMFLPAFAPSHIRYAATDEMNMLRSIIRGKMTLSRLIGIELLGPSPELDEWEMHARHKALAFGYRLTMLLLTINLIVMAFFGKDITYVGLMFMAAMLYALHLLIPSLFLAQTIAPPDTE